MRFIRILDKLLPRYTRLPLLTCIVVNMLVYQGTSISGVSQKATDFTSRFDEGIPLLPGFIFIYMGCYLFWILSYWLISRMSKKKCFELATADLIGKLVCLVFFLFLPTTYIRPEIPITGISTGLVNYIYQADMPTHLLPSIHCLISWYCFVSIRSEKGISRWYKIFAFLFASLVCLSTVFVKQHVLIDIPAGILLAEISWLIATRTKISEKFMLLVDKFPHSNGKSI